MRGVSGRQSWPDMYIFFSMKGGLLLDLLWESRNSEDS